VTLLELLVTLVIVGVLAAFAYPAYHASLLRAHRVEAIDALLAIGAAQERFHVQHGRYARYLDDGTATPDNSLAVAAVSVGGRYRLSLLDAGPADFLATATPAEGSGQEADRGCRRFSIRANGQRSATDSAGAESTHNCWG
jgi:type IV pilus assembly protein PilE